MNDKYERFIASYLRLNGYFTITNFIVHAGDDLNRRSCGIVGNHTETDVLGVRMPYSAERTGSLLIKNHPSLAAGSYGKFDIVIAEVKSGNENKPNNTWRRGSSNYAIEYVVRFAGLHEDDEISTVASALASNYRFEDERCRLRYIIFANETNQHYMRNGVTHITLEDVIRFIVVLRGQCWIENNLGVASSHPQWDDILKDVFEIANEHKFTCDERLNYIKSYLASEASSYRVKGSDGKE